jgi:translation elongation factor EF-1beta
LQKISYNHNIRGWLKSINDVEEHQLSEVSTKKRHCSQLHEVSMNKRDYSPMVFGLEALYLLIKTAYTSLLEREIDLMVYEL